MVPSPAPAAAPTESLYQRAPLLTPEALRGEIQRLTADQLDQLVREMDAARNVPPIFRNALVQRAIEDRVAVADATREQWRALQRLIETTPPPAPPPAPLAPPPAPLSSPPSPLPSPTGSIAGDTGVREWAGDHKGMIAATAGLAILGFLAIRHIAKRREQFEREDKEDAERAGQPSATAPEARKRSWFWKLLIPGAAIGIPSAIAIKAYQNRKEIAAKAKEGAEKVQKGVKESAEAQEGIENARYGLVSAGLLLLDRDLMPESTRISDTQRRRILTGFLEDQRVQNVPVSQVLGIENERDVLRVFGDVIANRPADERRVLFFLAQSCKKHQEYVTNKARRLGLSDEEIMQMPLIEYVDQLAEVSSTLGNLTNEIATKGIDGFNKIDWNKDIFNLPQFVHHLKSDRIFMRRIVEHYPQLQTRENAFLMFCTANGNKTMHNLPQQLRQNIPEEKKQEWQMFQETLGSMHQFIQDQTAYLLKYAHGEERFAKPLAQYLQNQLTVFDTVQLYYYLQQMIGENGNFLELKDSPPFTSFLLQTKIISMVKRENEDAGQRMFINLVGRGAGALVGAATNIELPEKTKKLFQSAAGTILSGTHKMLTEVVHKGKQIYQSGLMGSSPEVGLAATAGGFLYLQTKWNNLFDTMDAKWFIRTPAPDIAARYGISLEAASYVKGEAKNMLGKTWYQKYTKPGFETGSMYGKRKFFKPWERDDQGGLWGHIRREQKVMTEEITGKIGKELDDLQFKFNTHATDMQTQLKGATDRATAKNIMRTFNGKNQQVLDDVLDQMADTVSKGSSKTFVELAKTEPHLAEAISRAMHHEGLVTAFGHRINIFKRAASNIGEGVKSRTKLFLPLLILRALSSEEKIPLANLAGSTAVQLTPIAGTIYDIDTLVTGKDRITGEQISRWQSAGFVAIGAATDTLTVLGAVFGFGVGGGAGVAARAAAFGARGGAKGLKAAKAAAKATDVANSVARATLKAEKIMKVARWARIGGYTYTIGNISYGLFSTDGQAPPENSEDMM